MRKFPLLLLTIFLVVNNAAANCQSKRPASPSDIGKSTELFKSMIVACKSGNPDNFFALQTTDANRMVNSSGNKRSLFTQYCSFTQDALRTLGGQPENGVHSIKQDNYKTVCGQKVSTWYVHSNNGALAIRLDVAVENGQLKIDTH